MSPSGPQPPASTRAAVRLIWGGAVLSLFGIVLLLTQTDAIREQAQSSGAYDVDDVVNIAVAFGVIGGLVGTGLWVWMAIMNGMGRSWARIVATVFGAIQIASQSITLILIGGGIGFGAVVDGKAVNPVPQSILAVCSLGVAITALVLMWRSSSSAWYDASGRARQAARASVQPVPMQVFPPNEM